MARPGSLAGQDDVLGLIDNALKHYEVSRDAMRWMPDAPRVICDGGFLWPGPPPAPGGAMTRGCYYIVTVRGAPEDTSVTVSPAGAPQYVVWWGPRPLRIDRREYRRRQRNRKKRRK